MRKVDDLSPAMTAAEALDTEADAILAFFAGTRRQRAETNWGPRQRRRNRVRRAAQ